MHVEHTCHGRGYTFTAGSVPGGLCVRWAPCLVGSMPGGLHVWWVPCLVGSESGGLHARWALSLVGSVPGGADHLGSSEIDDEMGTTCVNV